MMPTTTLAFSGGMDSSVLLWQLLKRGENVHCVYVDYGHRAGAQEWDAARRIVAHARNHLQPSQQLDLALVRVANFPDSDASPFGYSRDREFAHFGPLVMSAVVAHGLAVKAKAIACAVSIGAIVDGSGWMLANLFYQLHGGDKIGLSLPFVDRGKAWIVEQARQAIDGVSFWHLGAWSCLLDGEEHCGECRGCKARQTAFRDAAIADRTVYRSSRVPQVPTSPAETDKTRNLTPAGTA